jgi:enamine deaminase RidA (YjgF/YER057c/UK114 family)
MKTYVNPDTMHASPAFSQAVIAHQPSATIYVGGQNAISKDGQIVGDTIGEQVTQALINLELVLASADATIDDVVRWTVSLVQGHDVMEAFSAVRARYPHLDNPPAISVAVVAGLANPRFLVEIDAIAVR